MEILIVGVLTLLTVSVVIFRKYTEGKSVAETEPTEFCEYATNSTEACRDIINKALDSLAEGNVIEACENYRKGSEILYNSCALDKGRDIYWNYMVESVDKIAETTRHIVSKPGYMVSIYDKCEIMTIRKSIDEMLRNANSRQLANEYRQAVANNRYFLEDVISERSKTMKHDDFNDDSQSYQYLMLLYYLHYFVNSYYRYCFAK